MHLTLLIFADNSIQDGCHSQPTSLDTNTNIDLKFSAAAAKCYSQRLTSRTTQCTVSSLKTLLTVGINHIFVLEKYLINEYSNYLLLFLNTSIQKLNPCSAVRKKTTLNNLNNISNSVQNCLTIIKKFTLGF